MFLLTTKINKHKPMRTILISVMMLSTIRSFVTNSQLLFNGKTLLAGIYLGKCYFG